MDLIDTHQHLILRDRIGYAWTQPIPELATGDFTLQDYHDLTKGKGVVGTVFMETGVDDDDYKDEARMVAQIMRDAPGAPIGQIASCRPEFDEGFDEWLEEGEGLNIVGYRRILHVVPDDVSQSETFRRNLRKIGDRDLPFDINFLARQLPIARALVDACNNQVFVLDHCGVPDIAAGEYDEWARGIRSLAVVPQVVCKLSGISAYCAPGQASVEALRPYVDHILESFGPDRILWGGDWPVVNLGLGLPGWIDATRTLLSELTEGERAALGTGTARRVYGLEVTG
ncbi:MAG: amidohydrolase [Cereibacter sphaeroides]|uniref:Amidohydrolase n=1 Tax=Cereibacter sphaeroides TaxID=1063 RepID=A0A2W5SD92_CERSP|nr:MAG: amidohydrolase [Cereibacter sphaeroides]